MDLSSELDISTAITVTNEGSETLQCGVRDLRPTNAEVLNLHSSPAMLASGFPLALSAYWLWLASQAYGEGVSGVLGDGSLLPGSQPFH